MCLVISNCSEVLGDLTVVVPSFNSLPLYVPLSHAGNFGLAKMY